MSRRIRAWLGVIACCSFSLAVADGDDVLQQLGGAPSIKQLTEGVDRQVGSTIDGALESYDRIIQQQPFDVALRVQRCRFLDEYAASFETGSFLDELYEKAEKCNLELENEFPDHPEVLLSRLEASYGEERLRQGKEILSTLLYEGWTRGQLARLYAAMAHAAQIAEQKRVAVDYAEKALALDETADVRMLLAREYLARGKKERVIELLDTPFDTANHESSWYLLEKMQLLSRAGAPKLVAALYEDLQKAKYYNHLEAAKLLQEAHAIELARKELAEALEMYTHSTDDEKQRFLLELEHGDAAAALDAYNAWRDNGWRQDPLGANRIVLATRDLTLPWKARDLLALGFAVGVLALVALACGAPVALVHYWGFIRRHRSSAPYPSGGWQLRHAWGALAAFGAAATIGLYAAAPFSFDTRMMLDLGNDLRPSQWARYGLTESLLGVIAMIVVLRLGPRATQAWSDHWSLMKAIGIGLGLGLALRIPFALTVLSQPDMTGIMSDDELWQLLRHVRDEAGFPATLWLLAVAAPVVEEFIFRKVLLESFSAHVGFARANVLQAALFAAMHMDARAFLPLFGFGLLAAYLARRSGGLIAPMVMHAIFNLVVGVVILK